MKKKKYIVAISTMLLILLIGITYILYANSDRVGRALQLSRDDNIQLTITQTLTYIQESDDTENISDSEERTYTEDVGVIKKDGTTVYEKQYNSEYYRYIKDNKEYVLYQDKDIYQTENSGWIEEQTEFDSSNSLFDFDVFANYGASDFEKEDDYYVPKGDVYRLFKDLLGLQEAQDYYNCSIRLWVEVGHLTKLEVSFIYANTQEVIMTYEFAYDDVSVEVPEADVSYDGN